MEIYNPDGSVLVNITYRNGVEIKYENVISCQKLMLTAIQNRVFNKILIIFVYWCKNSYMNKTKIVIIENDNGDIKTIQNLLEKCNYKEISISSSEKALNKMKNIQILF